MNKYTKNLQLNIQSLIDERLLQEVRDIRFFIAWNIIRLEESKKSELTLSYEKIRYKLYGITILQFKEIIKNKCSLDNQD